MALFAILKKKKESTTGLAKSATTENVITTAKHTSTGVIQPKFLAVSSAEVQPRIAAARKRKTTYNQPGYNQSFLTPSDSLQSKPRRAPRNDSAVEVRAESLMSRSHTISSLMGEEMQRSGYFDPFDPLPRGIPSYPPIIKPRPRYSQSVRSTSSYRGSPLAAMVEEDESDEFYSCGSGSASPAPSIHSSKTDQSRDSMNEYQKPCPTHTEFAATTPKPALQPSKRTSIWFVLPNRGRRHSISTR